jgi:hypothetical protein
MQASLQIPPVPSWEEDEGALPPPDPAQRLPMPIDQRDAQRLELLAVLTEAGIAPASGDREAIEYLSALPSSVAATVRRWVVRGL